MASCKGFRAPWGVCKRIRPTPSTSHPQRALISSTPSFSIAPEADKRNAPSVQDAVAADIINLAKSRNIPIQPSLQGNQPELRLPRNVQSLYLAPLRRQPTHNIPVCNLQLRSYSVRNLELTADIAMRAAYYLHLPASGPVSLPRITERWTVIRSNFVHKKSQENWERRTCRRLIQIKDGDGEVVRRWLAFMRRWCWYGVGMKADVWESEGLGVGKRMDDSDEAVKRGMKSASWELFGRQRGKGTTKQLEEILDRRGFPGRAMRAKRTKKATNEVPAQSEGATVKPTEPAQKPAGTEKKGKGRPKKLRESI